MRQYSIQAWFVVVGVIIASSTFAVGTGNLGDGNAADYTRWDVVMLVLYILLALIFSFLCSVSEAVLLSITPSYIAGLDTHQPHLAAKLKQLKLANVDRSLAAILTLNTIAHTVGAIGAGAKATIVFGNAWFGLFSALMTLAILFLSEIIPKTLGAVYWRALARPTAYFVQGLIWVLYPLIWISERLTRWISRNDPVQVFSRDEFLAMAGMGKETGKIHEHESRIISNLFRFGLIRAKDIMTPRTVIHAFQEDITVAQAWAADPENPFSRVLVYGKHIDDMTGFVLKRDMLLAKVQNRDQIPLVHLKRHLPPVPAEMRLSNLLEFLLDQRQHIALVINEYGGTEGLVTLEDVVETLLGMEIVDEMDEVEDMQALARKQWEKRAAALGLNSRLSAEAKGDRDGKPL